MRLRDKVLAVLTQPMAAPTVNVMNFSTQASCDDRESSPHCDTSVLHAPGECKYCDLYPERQADRDMQRINFTGHHEVDRAPCPSLHFRSGETRDRWPGNLASQDGVEPTVKASLTTDPTDPRLGHGVDEQPAQQQDVYLVLSEQERARGFVRPLRRRYVHTDGCGTLTTMGLALCETYARDPSFYGATFCAGCRMHRPVHEFTWDEDGQVVGS